MGHLTVRRRDSESSVDDLRTKRGVVLGRAVATLRSVETHPFAWRIRYVGLTILLRAFEPNAKSGKTW